MHKILLDFYDRKISSKINISTKVDSVNGIVKDYRLNKFPKYQSEVDLDKGYHLFIDFPINNEENIYSADSDFEIATVPTLSLHSIHLNFVLMLLQKSSLNDYFLMLANRLKDGGILFIRELDSVETSLKEAKICNSLLRLNSNVNLHNSLTIDNAFAKAGFSIIKIDKKVNYNEYTLIKGIKPYDPEQLQVINLVFNDIIPFEPDLPKKKRKSLISDVILNDTAPKEVYYRKKLSVPPKNDFYWSMVSGYWINDKLMEFIRETISEDLSNYSIFDMNAGLGGDTMRFMKYFKKVYATEIYGPAINHLKNNIEVYIEAGVILNDNLDLYQSDNVELVKTLSVNDNTILYCDPPWESSKNQNTEYMIDISGYDLDRFISIVKDKYTHLILKIPGNTPEIIGKEKYKVKHVSRKGKNYDIQFVIIRLNKQLKK